MNIAGVVIHARPEQMTEVQETMLTMPGVEIHGSKEDGRLVVTIEDEGYKETSDTILNLHQIRGVLSASLVYQHSEDFAEDS